MTIQFLNTRTIGNHQYAPGELMTIDEDIGKALIACGDAREPADEPVEHIEPTKTVGPVEPVAVLKEEHHG